MSTSTPTIDLKPLARCEHNRELACTRCARESNRFGALALMMHRWATSMEIKRIRLWQDIVHLGNRIEGPRHTYTITSRGLGTAVATFDDGTTKTIEAPVPFA